MYMRWYLHVRTQTLLLKLGPAHWSTNITPTVKFTPGSQS